MGWGLLGQVVYLITQFLTLVALTRLATIEDVGTFGLATSLVIPVFFFFNLNMQVNFASGASTGFGFRDFRNLLLMSVVIGYLVIVGISFAALTGLTASLVLILGLAKASESLSELSYGVFQRYEHMHLMALSLILRGVISTVTIWTLLWLGYPVVTAFFCQMIIWVLMALFFDLGLAQRLARSHGDDAAASLANMRKLVTSSMMLALTGLLSALHGNIPRYLIATFLNVVSLGYYTVIGYAMQATITFFWVIMQSLIARFTFYKNNRQIEDLTILVRNLALGVLAFMTLAVGASLLIGDWLIAALFGPDYTDLGTLLAVAMLAASIQGFEAMMDALLVSNRRFRSLFALRVLSVALVAGCAAIGVMTGGLIGVAWGLCAAFTLHCAALVVTVRPLLRAT